VIGDQQEAQGFEYIPPAPAGALSATATDLANFMIAHLQNGRFGEARILQEATAQAMHRQHFTHDPRVNGFAHGFMESTLNGQRLLMHGGDTIYFHSILVLLPEKNVGFFVSYNGSTGALAVFNTLRAFMDHYFPAPASDTPASAVDFTERAQAVIGSYIAARSNQSTPEKIAGLLGAVTIQAGEDNELVASLGAPAEFTFRYVEREPLVYTPSDIPPSMPLLGLAPPPALHAGHTGSPGLRLVDGVLESVAVAVLTSWSCVRLSPPANKITGVAPR
jgi:hypothetical protein